MERSLEDASARPRRRRPGRGQRRRPRRARTRPHRRPARHQRAAHHRSRPPALRRRAREASTRAARSWCWTSSPATWSPWSRRPASIPSTFARGITQTEWRELLDNPERPLHNKSIAGVYPPGSTYKMVTALAALESKAIDPWTRLPCAGHPRARQHQVPLLAEGRPRLDQRQSRQSPSRATASSTRPRAGRHRSRRATSANRLGFGKRERPGPARQIGRQPAHRAVEAGEASARPGSTATPSTSASARAT